MKCNFINCRNTKLILYVVTASLASLTADLNHYIHPSAPSSTVPYYSLVTWIIIVLNFVLQGLVAWRAFIDDSEHGTKEDKAEKPSEVLNFQKS